LSRGIRHEYLHHGRTKQNGVCGCGCNVVVVVVKNDCPGFADSGDRQEGSAQGR